MDYQNENIIITDAKPLTLLPLQYVKNYLRIDNDNDDEFLANAIITAINYAEAITGKIFGEKTYKLTFNTKRAVMKIDKMPIVIDEIINITENENTLNNEQYTLENGVVYLKKGIVGKIVVIFKAGMQTGDIPVDIRQALMFHIANIYEHKDGNFNAPLASQEIYNMYRKIRI